MNSMFSVWTLSSLILSYTLAFPIFNNQSGSHTEIPNITELNSTEYVKTNPTNRPEPVVPKRRFLSLILSYTLAFPIFNNPSRLDCPLATCSLSNLGSFLQIGDEIAGNLTRNPFGIGKK
ncbi:hypothetical protein DPX16_13059 [Anabarilius grahami]|uniref:Uncharacterized protein n=1 Tax=Anabarilius grahami TaxID=495550 RepID=A0A3N0XDP2_ANAGA|nr:hypothetical protein DPX16_13059 [Anabarilius grahami]